MDGRLDLGAAGQRALDLSPAADSGGLAAREVAVDFVAGALAGRRTLDAALDAEHGDPRLAGLSAADRGLVKALATETLRRRGQIRDALARFLQRRPPRGAGPLQAILDVAACQILFLDIAPHAAVDTAVRLAAGDERARHYKGLVNAVLRRLAETRGDILESQDAAALNTPAWLAARWRERFGFETARAIQFAHLGEPPLDLTVRGETAQWAERLGGVVLATGSVRLVAPGPVTALNGYAEGAWWVQDAAASLPARLLGEVAGRDVADFCAAPGGKTSQLAAAGARVVAVDRSQARLARLEANLARLGLSAETVAADAADWHPDRRFDAVLIDAPCTATGTLRRHPDIAWARRPREVASLAALQQRLLDHALRLVRPGGTLVYAVCSLEADEGEARIARILSGGGVERMPISPEEIGGLAQCVTAVGDLQTLPCHDPGAPGGMDGFFAARLRRSS